MTHDIVAVHVQVFGHVQGVGFRAWAASQARRLGITGMVRNCQDHSVEIFAESDSSTLEEFIQILKEGNSYSSVEKLLRNSVALRGYSDFSIEL